MKFENEFGVDAPADQVYDTLLDLERVAPCMPGAEVLERIDDDSYKVRIKVKLGPISMQYRGQVEIIERDPEARRAVMNARATETRGQGMANARVQVSVLEGGQSTKGTIETDVQLTGKAAAMGQGVIQDVSASLVKTFAANLEEMLAEDAPTESEPAPHAQASESLPVGSIAADVAKGRLREPRSLAIGVGVVVLLGLGIWLLVSAL
jgi:carbon monoxide dehydrogenase subunit G